MSALLEQQDTDLFKRFTGMELLQKTFRDLVAATTLPNHLLGIVGEGGAGKSFLLRRFRLHCKNVGIPVALAAGKGSRAPIDILQEWADGLQASHKKLPKYRKSLKDYHALQVRVKKQASHLPNDQANNLANRSASVAAESALGTAVGIALDSIVPGMGMLGSVAGSVVGNLSGEAIITWLHNFFSKSETDLWLYPEKRLTDDFLDDLASIAKRERVVLLFDTFEQMLGLDDWVSECAHRLPSNVLLVIAGRVLPEWMPDDRIEQLEPMTDEVMGDLVRNYYGYRGKSEPNTAQVEVIVRFARGLPLAGATAAELCVNHDVTDFEEVRIGVVANLVKQLFKDISKELLPMLEAAATVRRFDESILCAVSKRDNVSDAFAELCAFPFTELRTPGYMLHDIVREIIDENVRVQNPERHSELHERAAVYFEARSAKVSSSEAKQFEMERLYHRIRLNEEAGIKLFQGLAESLARYGLYSQLRILLNDVSTYKTKLQYENSRLWLEYYKARLAQGERRHDEAEKIFQTITDNFLAEPKLMAYALCDWGEILVRVENLFRVGVSGKARYLLERARYTTDIDTKLVFIFTHLSRVYGLHGEWQQVIDALQQQLAFFQQSQDYIGIVETLAELRWTYGRWGNWKKALEAETQAHEVTAKIPGSSFLKAKLVKFSWIALWAGRYQAAEHQIRQGLSYAMREGDLMLQVDLLMILGYALGLQNKFDEALPNFNQSFKVIHEKNLDEDWAISKGFLGHFLVRRGELEQAEANLQEALVAKLKIRDDGGIPEIRNWLGELYELRRDWQQAASQYDQSLNLRSIGRRHFECGTLVGLVRVRYALNDNVALAPQLAEAELLAQQFEYNDHLASLSLTQAQLAWGGPDALHYFQHALIYALRFNRFLLDEVLSGRPQGTPLSPIIPHLKERGDEGRRMLVALREWWGTGINDTGTPRPDTISLIPEVIPLLEAERLARWREPGDGVIQQTVIEQINQALDPMR